MVVFDFAEELLSEFDIAHDNKLGV